MKKIYKKPRQLNFEKISSLHQFKYGGILRKQRAGRKQRPLSTREALHVVFKVDKYKLRSKTLRSTKSYNLIHGIIQTYSKRFFVQIEQISIQNDHCHLLVRTKRRSSFHHFFRVVAGQIAQIFEKEGLLLGVTDTPKNSQIYRRIAGNIDRKAAGTDSKKEKVRIKAKGTKLWLYRPFSRVIRSYKAYLIARDYIQLNEKEALGQIKYNSKRLKGLIREEWEKLWT